MQTKPSLSVVFVHLLGKKRVFKAESVSVDISPAQLNSSFLFPFLNHTHRGKTQIRNTKKSITLNFLPSKRNAKHMSSSDESIPLRIFLDDIKTNLRKASLDSKGANEASFRLFQLYLKIGMLQVLTESIGRQIQLHTSSLAKQNNRRYYTFLAELEAYFYLIMSSLDMIARFTCHFYPENLWIKHKEAKRYFSHQLDFFKNNKEKEPEYAKYLAENMKWFEKIRKHRNELTHNGALTLFFGADGKVYFGSEVDAKGFIPNEEIRLAITETYYGLCDFLAYYNRFFSTKEILH